MSYNPQNPNGQATSANSSPVVIASDQSAVGTDHAKTAGTTTSVNNGTSDAGTQRVTIASDSTGQIAARGTVASGAADSGNPVKVGGVFNTSPPTVTNGQRVDLQADANGNLKVNLTNGTVAIGANSSVNVNQIGGIAVDANSGVKSAGTQRVVLATDQPQLTNALKVDGSATTQPVSGTVGLSAGSNTIGAVTLLPTATGGWSVNSQTALTNTKVAVKASAGTFGGYMIYNSNAAAIYVQVFDVASGSVTLGTTAPTYVITIPPAAGANVEFTLGINHAAAITLAATTTATGSTAPTTALTGFFLFK